MKRALLLTMSVMALVTAPINPAPASAGGWAITTLDPFDQPVAGQPIAIGFTILQHGVTPVDLLDVGIRVTERGKPGQFFPAVADGPDRVGHYTASVVFPSVGTFSWLVEQGFFEPQDLGEITITAAAGGPAVTGEAREYSAMIRYGLPLTAALCAILVALASVRGRRRLTAA